MKWYAIRTEPGRETVAEYNLRPRVEETYLPMIMPMVDRKRGTAAMPKPLITGYMFGRVEMSQAMASAIKNSRGVLNILPTANNPVPISDAAMMAMRDECDKLIRSTGDTPDLDWMIGGTFAIIEGPWIDRVGMCIAVGRGDVPVIMLEAFNQMVPVQVPVEMINLEAIGDKKTPDVDVAPTRRYTSKIKNAVS